MPNGPDFIFPIDPGDIPGPRPPELLPPGEGGLPPPGRGFVPPVVPFPIPGVTQPPVQIPPVGTAPAAAPGFGSILARVGLPIAIGSVVIELIERIAGELQAGRARDLAERAEAEIQMIRGRIRVKEQIFEVATEAEGSLLPPAPPGRDPALFDLPRFPFEDPFESPLADDPLPPTGPVGPGVIIAPIGTPTVPVSAPLPDVPTTVPTIPAPTLPETLPAPAPATTPRTPTRPATLPRAPTLPAGLPLPAPVLLPFSLPRPSIRPFVRPARPTLPDLPTDVDPISTLTPFEPLALPSPVQVPTRCGPCRDPAEEREDPRTECFKKLVKESRFPSLDESFNWVEISCETGKELT